ncbi:OLC1v1019905C1 [Oldenlandia corymbosa var. corymbosa]|uniref:OLC1v1019905C1 n=1 Tax=Oldenlandia corymbosa var. corymbosa TaxID=529605 RepID=A0AAV1EF78_OLDCO|nr:OLC1v1019905C1 [Oldenlandia corymbosa var. corymbosa]
MYEFKLHPERKLLKGFYHCALGAIKDPLIIVLIVYTVLHTCFGLKEFGTKSIWPEWGTKLLEIFVVVIASAVSKFWPVSLSRELNAAKEDVYSPRVDVVREGVWIRISISRVVFGDVVFLKPGDQVPADGLFIDGDSLQLEPVENEPNSRIRLEVGRIDMVVGGCGRIVVVTAASRNWRNLQPHQVTWMVQKHVHELENLTSIIGRFGKAFAVSTFLWFLFLFVAGDNNEELVNGGNKSYIVQVLIALPGMLATPAIIALASSLEDWVLAVKTTLAYSMRSFLRDERVLIKKPHICHHVASVDTICFNKTGTLTSDS